jgi:DNA-binding GntR family transcriptional regulator
VAVGIEGDLSTSHQIANELKNEILSGKYPPGSRLRQEDIASKFRASRSPVREALRMLESDGLINLVANTGAWIAQLSLAECEEMYQIRERTEPLLLRLSIPNLAKAQISQLAELKKDMEKCKTTEEFLQIDREFHLCTYSGAKTALLHEMVARLWNTTQHYRRAYSKLLEIDRFQPAHYEHDLLFRAIKSGDVDDGERILFGHIRRTRLELAKHPDVFIKNVEE